MSNISNVNRVLVSDGFNSAVPIASLSSIQKGDLVLLDEAGNILTATTAAALPRFAKVTIGVGIAPGIANLSAPIQGNTTSKYEGQKYVAPTEGVQYLGYNGTASTTIPATDTTYRLRILVKDKLRVQGQRSTLVDIAVPSLGASGTAYLYSKQVAGLFAQKEYGQSFQKFLKLKLDRTANGTKTALAAAATVTNGSKTVTVASHGLGSAGATVYLSLAPSVVAAAFSDSVYGATVVDANTLLLDVPYNGASGSIAAGTAVNQGASLSTPTEWGFKVSSTAINSKVNNAGNSPLDPYEWTIFDATYTSGSNNYAGVSGNVAGAKTNVTTASPGQGYWKQVADREEAAKGYYGDTDKRNYYAIRIPSLVDVNTTYSSIVISHAAGTVSSLQDLTQQELTTEIYIPSGAIANTTGAQLYDTATTSFLSILNAYFGTVIGFPAITTASLT